VLSRNSSCPGPTQLTIPHTNTLTTTHILCMAHTHTISEALTLSADWGRANVIVKLTRRSVLWDPLHRNGLFTMLANISKPLKAACWSQIVPDHLGEDPRQSRCRAHCVRNANKQTHWICPLSWTELYSALPMGCSMHHAVHFVLYLDWTALRFINCSSLIAVKMSKSDFC